MDKIYKTKYGTWIDLSHIQEIGQTSPPFSNLIQSVIIMMFQDQPLIRSINGSIEDYENDLIKSKEAFEDLLQAWKDYNKQSNERKTNFIGKL